MGIEGFPQRVDDKKKAEAMAVASDPERSDARVLREIGKGDLNYGGKKRTFYKQDEVTGKIDYKPVGEIKQDAADRAKVQDREADRLEEAAGKAFDEAKRQEK